MAKAQEFERGLGQSDASVASFESHVKTPFEKAQHFLHSNQAAVPLIVLILSIAIFGILVGGKFFNAFSLTLIIQQVAIVGIIGGTSQQYPLLMASMGVEAIKKFADTGEKPGVTEGKNFFDTGVALITDAPVEGVPSIDTKEGLAKCWG